ncbi:hypothetical protein [Rhizobium laguerreae]|uniref:hypothetical protein n=1 Tax=Rhizobium laguerreae TaxID=1076926 RepID=UPI001C92648A|nr:hypothetical protein [Rhizobium laguerreae]MBY3314670.1 hypothetical protein [Rhizobium laguerreae]
MPHVWLHDRDEHDYIVRREDLLPHCVVSVRDVSEDVEGYREVVRRLAYGFNDYAALEVAERHNRDCEREIARHIPTTAELDAAPWLEGWAMADEGHPWMHGWFFGHPEIEDGTHGHTSSVLQVDEAQPPRWVRTESRLYRLGVFYPPAEREIRYWTQKHSGRPVGRGDVPGGSDDIETMLAFLRSTGRIREAKVDRMEQAYREERERLS